MQLSCPATAVVLTLFVCAVVCPRSFALTDTLSALSLQPGLIVIGLVNVIQPVNPFCRCCPKQLPQEFSLGLEPVAGENFLNDMP